jgi:hypothetical protein
MEAMLGISLYSYLYLKEAKILFLPHYLLCFSSTKLEKRAEQDLPGSEKRVGGGGERVGRGGGRGQWGEIAQTMYAHMNSE